MNVDASHRFRKCRGIMGILKNQQTKLGSLLLNSYHHDHLQRSFALHGLSIENRNVRSQENLPSGRTGVRVVRDNPT